MSIKLMNAAWSVKTNSTDKLVLIALADNASDEGFCWPSVATIARKTNLSRRGVQASVARLQKEGFLSRVFRNGRSTNYMLSIIATGCPPAHVVHPTCAPGAPPPAHVVHPEPSSEPSMNLKLEEPPTPLSEKPEIKNARTRKRKPQTFINPDYKPDFKSIALAAELGIDLEAERRKFINYWLGRGDSKADWDATFRNWIGRSAEYSAERKQRQANGRQGPASVVEAALRVAARYQTNS